jgi:hypothetical protein
VAFLLSNLLESFQFYLTMPGECILHTNSEPVSFLTRWCFRHLFSCSLAFAYDTKKTTHVLKGFSLQVLEFLEEMSGQLSDPANVELSLLKDLKVCTEPFFALFHFTPLIMPFSLIISIFYSQYSRFR